MKTRTLRRRTGGFTLIELAVVVMVMALLLGGLIATLSAQFDARNAAQTEQTMQLARDALIGFAIRQGRLPCPAVDAGVGYRDGTNIQVQGTGEEAMLVTSIPANPESTVNGQCASYVGLFPALTLGVGPTDAQGYLLDGWGGRVRYAVTGATSANPRNFTTANRLRTLGFAVTPDVLVCTSAPSAADKGAGSCGAGNPGTRAPAVIVSRGKNFAAVPAAGPDETDNADGDRFFVAHAPAPIFDDQLLWLSENVLYSRMIAGSGF